MDRILNMILRRVIGRLVNRGVDAGINAMTRQNGGDDVPNHGQGQAAARTARGAFRMARRITHF